MDLIVGARESIISWWTLQKSILDMAKKVWSWRIGEKISPIVFLDYPELLDIPDLIIPQDDSHSSSESDSDSTIILPHDVDSDDTIIRSE
jgi:hypothetical protein